MSQHKACFLDRDGVINRPVIKNGKSYPPSNLEEFEILPKVPEAIRLLRQAGFLTIVVTNQPDVGRGWQKQEVVEEMHQKLRQELLIDDIFTCFYETSPLYKPSPAMLLEAAKKYQINLKASYMVGDRWRDVGAGKAAGCTTIFINHHYEESLIDIPDFTCSNLLQAVQILLQKDQPC